MDLSSHVINHHMKKPIHRLDLYHVWFQSFTQQCITKPESTAENHTNPKVGFSSCETQKWLELLCMVAKQQLLGQPTYCWMLCNSSCFPFRSQIPHCAIMMVPWNTAQTWELHILGNIGSSKWIICSPNILRFIAHYSLLVKTRTIADSSNG